MSIRKCLDLNPNQWVNPLRSQVKKTYWEVQSRRQDLVRGSRWLGAVYCPRCFYLFSATHSTLPHSRNCCLTQDQRPKAKGQTMNPLNSGPEQTLPEALCQALSSRNRQVQPGGTVSLPAERTHPAAGTVEPLFLWGRKATVPAEPQDTTHHGWMMSQ